MKRREFIALLGGAARSVAARRARAAAERCGASACSDAARTIRKRQARMLALPAGACSNSAGPMAATCKSTIAGAAGDADRIRRHAAELVALAPDVILARGDRNAGPLLQATRTVPIVFVNVADPVGAGFVESLARPGGNVTGFIQFEYSFERQMAGAAQADRAGRDAGGGASRSRHNLAVLASSPSSRPWHRRSGWR